MESLMTIYKAIVNFVNAYEKCKFKWIPKSNANVQGNSKFMSSYEKL